MATNFPASLDSLTNPAPGDALNNPSHSSQHTNTNDAIDAIQAKLGVDGSAVTTSVDYKLRNLTGSVVDQLEESWNLVDLASTGTVDFNFKTSSLWAYTVDATANWVLNVRADASTTLASQLEVGDSITVVFANTNGATAYYMTSLQIDGVAVTPKWQGGNAPTAGTASAVDLYTFVIRKDAATPTYTVFASFVNFS